MNIIYLQLKKKITIINRILLQENKYFDPNLYQHLTIIIILSVKI